MDQKILRKMILISIVEYIIMIQDNLRQSNGSDGGTHARTNGRVTRGYSNLPKEEPKVESSSSSEE
jgi:hypothetical protein